MNNYTCCLLLLCASFLGGAYSFAQLRSTPAIRGTFSSSLNNAREAGGDASIDNLISNLINDDDAEAARRCNTRRRMLQSAIAAPTASLILQPAVAAADANNRPPPIIPLTTTAKRLRAVPTFTIVDGKGVPFHTYEKDSAGGFGYFFTSFASAEFVLDDAKAAFSKAKSEILAKRENGEEGAIGEDGMGDIPDAWGQAQIVTIPLDIVLQLSIKKTQSVATNGEGKKFNTFYQVVPESTDMNAALRIENSPRYSERGRVPLFFVDELTLPSKEEQEVVDPVFFRMKDLKTEWQRQYPDRDLPNVHVRELNETFRSMIRPGGNDKSVKNLVFVPILESVEKSKACGRTYKLGEMILTR